MNDYYNNYNNQYNNPSPQAPSQPPQPPMAPQINSYPNPPQAPQQPQQYYRPAQPQPPQNYYNQQYQPPAEKQKGSGAGLKVLLAIVITLLVASIAGFTVFVANFSGRDDGFKPIETQQQTEPATSPFAYNPTEPATTANSYKESDASNKTQPDYKGLKLKKKPKKIKKNKYGSSYAFKNVEKSTVGVICYTSGQQGNEKSYSTMGSGVVLTADGYIVTNSHIVNDSRTDYLIKIVTADKKEYKAGVVGFDSRYDLAVLKVDAKNLTPATFGDSDQIEVTEDVIVVGNPRSMNYQNSVTKGIVSAVNRRASMSNNARFIQTDAAINPGNSGGGLCNMYGQVIGISTMKIALETYEGMCFAIPSKTVKQITDEIIRNSYVSGRVKIGITGNVVYYGENNDTGIQIEDITSGGPMAGTDAESGDIITKVDGVKIANFADVYDILEKHKAGDEIEIEIIRPDNEKTFTVKVKLAEDKP